MATHLILQKIFKTGIVSEPPPEADLSLRTRVQALHADILKVYGQAVAIRHVDAGSCNGCELEIHAVNGPHYKLSTLRQAQSERKRAMKSGRGSAHAEPVEAWGEVFHHPVKRRVSHIAYGLWFQSAFR